jgi:hypothetical protein
MISQLHYQIKHLMYKATFGYLVPGRHRHSARIKHFFTNKSKILRYLYWLTVFKNGNAIPLAVDIETQGQCNRACSYCPVSISEKRTGKMSDTTFSDIISQMIDMKFKGQVRLSLYNEPLLDKNLEKFISYTRSKLIYSVIKFNTNGDIMTVDRVKNLFNAGVDIIEITNHDNKASKKLQALMQKVPKKYHDRIIIYDICNIMLHDKGGILELPEDVEKGTHANKFGCVAQMGLVIDYRGNALLCCNDYYAKNSLFTLPASSILSAWKKGKELRREIFFGRYKKQICIACTKDVTIS